MSLMTTVHARPSRQDAFKYTPMERLGHQKWCGASSTVNHQGPSDKDVGEAERLEHPFTRSSSDFNLSMNRQAGEKRLTKENQPISR